MDDEGLRRLADQLNTKLGRPPKAEELIAAAGGCQRKRALAAIKGLKLDLAERAVRSGMLFPAPIERALRSQMATWMDLAAGHLAERHLEESERVEATIASQAALVDELQAKVRALQEGVGDRERMVSELTQRALAVEAQLKDSEAGRLRSEVLAAERGRMLDELRPMLERIHGAHDA